MGHIKSLEKKGDNMEKIASEALKLASHIVKSKSKQVWIDYDEEADVVYISFEKPQGATDSELNEDNVLVRKRGGKIVGMTILNASKYAAH